MTTVAVIGGGVAGLMACRQALRAGVGAMHWFRAVPGSLGTAYDTPCESHLLNVPAARMGLDPADPAGFHAWLAVRWPGRWEPTDFVPRRRFGEYLREAVLETLPRLNDHPVRASAATRASGGWRVTGDDEAVHVDHVVVAAGLPLRRSRAPAGTPPVREAWDWCLDAAASAQARTLAGDVWLVGSGLTAVDMVLALRDFGFTGDIHVVSPSARWPQPHDEAPPLPEPAMQALRARLAAASTAGQVVHALRSAAAAHPWRGLLDSLRPHSNALWAEWPVTLRERLLRCAFGVWNRHRHRVPAAVLQRVLDDDGVTLCRGRFRWWDGEARVDGAPLRGAGLVLLCAGPAYRTDHARDPLIAGLLAAGHLQRHPLGTGLIACAPSIHLLGALRFGERFETTAVPDLRAQAGELDFSRR